MKKIHTALSVGGNSIRIRQDEQFVVAAKAKPRLCSIG
jgi:hypothetical protein